MIRNTVNKITNDKLTYTLGVSIISVLKILAWAEVTNFKIYSAKSDLNSFFT